MKELDALISDVAKWIAAAGGSLLTFSIGKTAFFTVEAGGTKDRLNLSALRSFVALVGLLHVFEEEEDNLTPQFAETKYEAAIKLHYMLGHFENGLNALASEIDSRGGGNLRDIILGIAPGDGDNEKIFWLSHFALALSATEQASYLVRNVLKGAKNGWQPAEKLASKIETCMADGPIDLSKLSIVSKEISEFLKGEVGKEGVTILDEVHDVITFYAVRAVDALDRKDSERSGNLSSFAGHKWDGLVDTVRNRVLVQAGADATDMTAQFSPVDLVSSIALLRQLTANGEAHVTHQLTSRALEIVANRQTENGAWPFSRVLATGGARPIIPPSVEVAYILASVLVGKLDRDRLDRSQRDETELLMKVLKKSFRFVTSTRWTRDIYVGWSDDLTRAFGAPQSWVTAIVLSFLVFYYDALLRVREALLLEKYAEVETPISLRRRLQKYMPKTLASEGDYQQFRWADLALIIGSLPKPDRDLELDDPTEEGKLAQSIKDIFLKPIYQHPVQRPNKALLILPGEPGTRKTTLVSRLAAALQWPLLTLSPSDFLRPRGLDQFEATAAEVFSDLLRLRRVVVFFDECEDFFRCRPEEQVIGERTIGAFITAGMLPRLQQLKDRHWIIFVLATNITDLNKIDPAVRRRFDYKQHITYPTLTAQVRYIWNRVVENKAFPDGDLESACNQLPENWRNIYMALKEWREALKEWREDEQSRAVTFKVLDELIKYVEIRPNQLPTKEEFKDKIGLWTQPEPPPLLG